MVVRTEYVYVIDEDGHQILVDADEVDSEYKNEYVKMREYLKKLQAKQRPTGDSLFDLF